MGFVACAAVFLTFFVRLPELTALAILMFLFLVPIFVATRAGRHLVAALIASILPSAPIFCLYFCRLIAWCLVGQRPPHSISEPNDFDNPIFTVSSFAFLFSFVGWLVGPVAGLMLGIERRTKKVERRTLIACDLIALLITPAMILTTMTVLGWDPRGAGGWFLD